MAAPARSEAQAAAGLAASAMLPSIFSEHAQLLRQSSNVRTEAENVRFIEHLIATSPNSQVAVRGWRILIGVELSMLARYLNSDDSAPAKVLKEEYDEWQLQLVSCTIGHIKAEAVPGVKGWTYKISVQQSRGQQQGDDARLADLEITVLPEASPGLEIGERIGRENVASAMECRFISLHQKLRQRLFEVGALQQEFGHEDPEVRRAKSEVRSRRFPDKQGPA